MTQRLSQNTFVFSSFSSHSTSQKEGAIWEIIAKVLESSSLSIGVPPWDESKPL